MSTLRQIHQCAQKHILVICIALAMSLLVVSPHIRAWLTVGPEHFEGVYPTFNDDEIYYQARIKEAAEGNITIGNPYLKEYENNPFIQPPLPEWVLGAFSRITGTSVPFVTSVSDAFFAFVDFLLLYVLVLLITNRRTGLSLISTSIFFITFLSTFGRPVSPQFNCVFLFVGLILLTHIYLNGKVESRKVHGGTGLLTGVTFFVSPYYFTMLFVLYGLLMLCKVFLEKSIVPRIRFVLSFFVGFIPCALLYIFLQHQGAVGDFYSESVIRFGLMQTHIPGSFTNIFFAGIAGIVLCAGYMFLTRQMFLYGLALVFSIGILNWQNIITGQSLQFSSHYLFTTILSVIMVLSLISAGLFSSLPAKKIGHKTLQIILAAGILCVLCVILNHQKTEFLTMMTQTYNQESLQHLQRKQDTFMWLRQHTPKDSVVYTLGGDYDFLLPVYTENKVYYNFYATLFIVSNEETENRWLIQHLFNPHVSREMLKESQRDFWGNRFIDIYQSTENRKKIVSKLTHQAYTPGSMVSDDLVEGVYSKWLLYKSLNLESSLKQYAINYILLGADYPYFTEAKAQLDTLSSVSLMSEINGDRIYLVN